MSDSPKDGLPERPTRPPLRPAPQRPAAAAATSGTSVSTRGSRRGMDTGLFLILLLLVAALLLQTIQQSFSLNRQRQTLNGQIEQQTETLREAQNARAQLEAIAGDTAALAEAGNANAIRMRDFLAQRGVTIRPPAAPQR